MNDNMQKARALLESPLGAQFDDPAFRQAAVKFDRILNDGENGGDLSGGELYEYATRLFSRELQKGVGDRLPDGSTIASKRIVQAYEDGDDIILELDITAQRPDGTEFDYRAPVTRGRTSEETDEVLRIPASKIRDRLRGASYMAQGIERAGGRQQVLDMLQAPQMGMQGPGPVADQQAPEMPAQGARMGLMGPGGVQ